jgi:hypothetical protein
MLAHASDCEQMAEEITHTLTNTSMPTSDAAPIALEAARQCLATATDAAANAGRAVAAAHSTAAGCLPDSPEAAAVAAAEADADIAASECAVARTAIAAAEAASADPAQPDPDGLTPARAVQCGCGVRGGASTLFRALQLGMEVSPEGATAQADISNGFGEVSREAIFFGLSFLSLDSLIPVARSLYGTPGSLVLSRTDGIMHVDMLMARR